MERESKPGEVRVGRRLFLAIILAGGGALAGGAQAVRGLGQLPVLKMFVPKDGFYFYTVTTEEPSFNGKDWTLSIEGLVENPVSLSYQELLRLAQTDQTHDYMCVTGWKVPRVRWQGPLVSTLLSLARPKPEATAVSFDSADGVYVDSLSLDEAMRPEVLMAHSLNGAPLERDRGAPLRLVIPFMFGYKGTKWVRRIRLTARQETGYWEQRGYDVNAYLK